MSLVKNWYFPLFAAFVLALGALAAALIVFKPPGASLPPAPGGVPSTATPDPSVPQNHQPPGPPQAVPSTAIPPNEADSDASTARREAEPAPATAPSAPSAQDAPSPPAPPSPTPPGALPTVRIISEHISSEPGITPMYYWAKPDSGVPMRRQGEQAVAIARTLPVERRWVRWWMGMKLEDLAAFIAPFQEAGVETNFYFDIEDQEPAQHTIWLPRLDQAVDSGMLDIPTSSGKYKPIVVNFATRPLGGSKVAMPAHYIDRVFKHKYHGYATGSWQMPVVRDFLDEVRAYTRQGVRVMPMVTSPEWCADGESDRTPPDEAFDALIKGYIDAGVDTIFVFNTEGLDRAMKPDPADPTAHARSDRKLADIVRKYAVIK